MSGREERKAKLTIFCVWSSLPGSKMTFTAPMVVPPRPSLMVESKLSALLNPDGGS